MPANLAAAAGASTATAEPTTEATTPEKPMPERGDLSAVMENLGIPSELREGILEEHTEPAATGEPAEAERIGDEPAAPAGDEPTGDEPAGDEPTGEAVAGEEEEEEPGEEPKAETPEWFQKRVGKLTRQRRKAEDRADAAEERATKAEKALAEIDEKPPVVFQASPADPLAEVTDFAGLEKAKVDAKALRDFCRANLNGYVAFEGTDKEKFVQAGEVASTLSYAEDILSEHVPKKQEHLKAQPGFTAQAKQLLPQMFQRGTVEHNAYQQTLRDNPWLANDPQRDLKAAVQIIGWQAVLARINKAREKGPNDSAPDKILRARENNAGLPLTRTSPPEKPRGGVKIQTSKEVMENAEKEMIETGGNEESTRNFARQMMKETAAQPNGREPALV